MFISRKSPDLRLRCNVDDDGRTICLYLLSEGDADFSPKVVWVRNRIPAPEQLTVVRGEPPVMPARYCRHPMGAGPIEESKIEIVWLPEGNGVALFEGEEMLAAIPPGSGMDGFLGYARDAIGESLLAWALGPDNPLHRRFAEARKYWDRWKVADDPWRLLQYRQLGSYERQLGKHTEYYAIDGARWPPKAIVRIPFGDSAVFVTVGVCLRPQPNVELYHASDPQPLHRIELGAVMRADLGEKTIVSFARYVAAQSDLPWGSFTWLSHGHSIPCDALEGTPYSSVILANSRTFGPYVELDDWDGLPVWLLWMVPVTDEELKIAKEKRSDTILSQITYPR